MPPDPAPKHFTMIRSFHLADLFTIANGGAGVAAVFQAMRFLIDADAARLAFAGAMVLLAGVLDLLDGRIARWRHTNSPLGRELDSLADVISFGVAPAAIGFAAGLRTLADEAVLIYFTVCGISRLARYNITAEQLAGAAGKVAYFEGTPIPTSIVPLAIVLVAFDFGWLLPVELLGVKLHLVSLLFALSGSLMISKTIRIPKP